MKHFDIAIIGASTTGSWFAIQMAKKGFSVIMIEKQKRENVSKGFDIFHMAKKEMEKFEYPIPVPGDNDYAFEFVGGAAYSAYGNYPKHTHVETVGMHKHEYILRLNDIAKEYGTEILYDTVFDSFVYDEKFRISGIRYKSDDEVTEISCSIVADCSGIASAARTKLRKGYGVENFVMNERDMFYVIVNYVSLPEDCEKVVHTDSYSQYKCWIAPQADPDGAIFGVGANLSFEYAKEMYKEFENNVKLPEYTLQKSEYGTTPYRRPPYSFVADGFIAMGDCACLTKPNNGEGCVSSIYQAEIAVDVISQCLREGGYLSTERLWRINTEYNDVQGKGYAAMRAMLVGAACMNKQENEYFFKHDVIFSEKIMNGLTEGLSINASDILHIVKYVAKGVKSKDIRPEFLAKVTKSALRYIQMYSLYSKFPQTPEGMLDWTIEADKLWATVGSMADSYDEEIYKRIKK